MSQTTIWMMGGTAAAVTLGLFVVAAEAQQPPAKAPAPAATTVAAAKATPAPPKAAKAPSACSKLLEVPCKAKGECAWVVPTKANPKTGTVAAAYCRLKPKAKTVAAPGAPKAAAPKAAPAPK